MAHFNKRWAALCALVFFMLTSLAPACGDSTLRFPKTGNNLLTGGRVTVDISNAEYGYIMAKHSGTRNRLKIIITHPSGQNSYDLQSDGQYQTFPLSYGNGAYEVEVFEQAPSGARDGMYQNIFHKKINVSMPDENASFLYPNQFVWYTEFSYARAKSMELCEGITSDIEKVDAIYSYIREKIRYDYSKARSVQSGYLPDVDQTLNAQAGICFDYAALFACMLRVQGIPTQLAIGDLLISDPPVTHAWNKVKIGNTWFLVDPTYDGVQYRQAQYVQRHAY